MSKNHRGLSWADYQIRDYMSDFNQLKKNPIFITLKSFNFININKYFKIQRKFIETSQLTKMCFKL